MQILNIELLQTALKAQFPRLKFIANEDAALFFPESQQHRSVKAPGVSYEDDYKGNAVAGLITEDHVEIRFHAAFSETRIRNLWKSILSIPELKSILPTTLYYQGKNLGDL